MAGRIRRKEVSAAEVVEDAIREAEALHPQDRGDLVTSDFDRALDKAKRRPALAAPFAGVPFLVKDLDDYGPAHPLRLAQPCLRARPRPTDQTPYIDAFDGRLW
jgi:amidase